MPKIITGHTGTPHITADDVGALLKAIIGSNDYLLNDNSANFTATLLENNVVQLSDAEIVLQGTHIRVQATDTATIEQGQNGMKRLDLIVCRYTKTDNGIESATIDVVKGTPAASDPALPAVTQGDIRGGALLHEMPLFKVELDGFSVASITNVCSTIASLKAAFSAFSGNIADLHQKIQSNYNSAMDSIENLSYSMNTQFANIKANNLLWSGVYYMNENHTVNLAKPISEQTNGIILVFSNYSNGQEQNYDFQSFVVPKWLVNKHSGAGHQFPLFGGLVSVFATKYLYISDKTIKGHNNNVKSGSGIVPYNNSAFVLRYVIGF